IDMAVHGDLPPYAGWYAAGRLRPVLWFSPEPVSAVHVELTSEPDSGVVPTVVASAKLRVAGRPVEAAAKGVSARQAIDRLYARLRMLLTRSFAGRSVVDV